jgi:hypothetical protein
MGEYGSFGAQPWAKKKAASFGAAQEKLPYALNGCFFRT